MRYVRKVEISLDKSGNFYFQDLTNDFAFIFVINSENICIDFFGF